MNETLSQLSVVWQLGPNYLIELRFADCQGERRRVHPTCQPCITVRRTGVLCTF